MTQDAVRDYLWEHADTYVSGEGLASALGISRTAVWKAIGQLKEQGYEIESVTRKGYRLLSRSDVLSEGGIRRHLKHPELSLQVFSTIGSTNTELKALAARNAEAGLALVASQQTAGRGRLGRSFYSPPDTGIYLSLLLRPRLRAQEATAITAAAAVAVAETLEELSGEPMEIKWVNDVYHHGRKVAGILTEAAMDFESGFLSYVVVGIPRGRFPGGAEDHRRGRLRPGEAAPAPLPGGRRRAGPALGLRRLLTGDALFRGLSCPVPGAGEGAEHPLSRKGAGALYRAGDREGLRPPGGASRRQHPAFKLRGGQRPCPGTGVKDTTP